MYTQNCLIKKNTPELRKKLENLGYDVSKIEAHSNYIITSKLDSTAIGMSEDLFAILYPYTLWDFITICESNEELFLAIAALQDDTDIDQWFVYPEENKWFICDYSNIEAERNAPSTRMSCQAAWFYKSHKATVNELIKHFQK